MTERGNNWRGDARDIRKHDIELMKTTFGELTELSLRRFHIVGYASQPTDISGSYISPVTLKLHPQCRGNGSKKLVGV